jgi:hypothetical protein
MLGKFSAAIELMILAENPFLNMYFRWPSLKTKSHENGENR